MMCADQCAIYLPIAMLPSIIWLLFFVFQDAHKVRIRDILYIFLWGIFIAIPVVIVEKAIQDVFYAPFASFAIASTLYGFLGVAFVEEWAKYLVVKLKAVPRTFFDEPQDAVIYMIAAALGFAAIENMAYAANFSTNMQQLIEITAFRGITSTFLHAAASGVMGYFLAISIFDKTSEKRKFLFIGLGAATVLHGIYNNFIMNIENIIREFECTPFANGGTCPESLFGIMLIALLLILSGIIITIGLHKLTKLKLS